MSDKQVTQTEQREGRAEARARRFQTPDSAMKNNGKVAPATEQGDQDEKAGGSNMNSGAEAFQPHAQVTPQLPAAADGMGEHHDVQMPQRFSIA